MSHRNVKKKDKQQMKSSVGWDKALVDAQVQLAQTTLRRNQLKEAIKIIETKIANKEEWPVDSAIHN